ncbi:MAG: hypothetical protein QGG36_06755 [Pirellulaceae bacterium]|jgi:hypothetical protein|nr:hypothetical protein [Pirellulaceae bacterium]MDP7015480.1 hypothetical protein [Pirellulaceae bacterium]
MDEQQTQTPTAADSPGGSRYLGPWQFRLRSILAATGYLCLWLAASRAVLSGLPGDRIWPPDLPAWTAAAYCVWTGVAFVQLGALLVCFKHRFRGVLETGKLCKAICWSFAPALQWSVITLGIIDGVIVPYPRVAPGFAAICFLHLIPLGIWLIYQRVRAHGETKSYTLVLDATWASCLVAAAAALPLLM